MEHQPDRERNCRGWLFRVAQRQAWMLDREAFAHTPVRSGWGPGDHEQPEDGLAPAR
jgi:hypothetical protein